jgi:hypothetical protein
MRMIVSAKILMEILPQLDSVVSNLDRADHVLRLGILRAQLFQLARELAGEQSVLDRLEGQEDQHQSIPSASVLS